MRAEGRYLLFLPETFSVAVAMLSEYDNRINEFINHNDLIKLMREREPVDETNRLF